MAYRDYVPSERKWCGTITQIVTIDIRSLSTNYGTDDICFFEHVIRHWLYEECDWPD